MTTETDPTDLRVLQVTTSNRSFFQQQVQVLEERGVECETLVVPRPRSGGRGPREYLSAYLQLLGKGIADFDLVHVNYGLIGPLALCQPTRPVVMTLWGSDVMGPRWLREVSRVAARGSDAVIAPSKPLARQLDVPHEFVPFGVDTDLFEPTDRDAARERVGWDTDERVVLFPYDPDRPVKNHELAERVVARVPNATLKTVTGVAYEAVPDYMNASDALLVTSDYESGPMSVCEATACNLPVVSRDVGFVSDVLEGVEPTGIADTEDELVAALTDVLDAEKQSNGRSVLDRGLDRLGRDLVRVYQKVLN
ncbi:glycosyltransferase [Halocatena pleomorpha]|uniref:Glycosyltransferase n=1 Tax=Halocatena pleomorpha TaxID=1785090 RepID=A0A3P3RDM7_9EURY|nr:glycosyltransferase [Halocatena pleomorpha]RRJ30553.1 glycosyltransferase [Halocatena pleomorpha]